MSIHSDTGTTRQEYYYSILDTESLLFSLLKQGRWGLGVPHQVGPSQERRTIAEQGGIDRCSSACDRDRQHCIDCCSTCGNSRKEKSSSSPPKKQLTHSNSSPSNYKDENNRDTDFVFLSRKSFKSSSKQNCNNNRLLRRVLTTSSLRCLKSLKMAQSSAVLHHHHSISSTSSLSSDNSSSSSSKTRRKIVSRLAKKLRDECDKILGSSESLIIDWRMLSAALKEIHRAESRYGVEDTSDAGNSADAKYKDLVLFLADLFKFTPALCITYTEAKSSEDITGTIDLKRFQNVKYLELKKVTPRTLSSLKIIKRNLTSLKCIRCIESISQVLTDPLMNDDAVIADKKLSCIWPELKELDLSFNQIETIDTTAVEAFDLCPLVETLNLSRNRISCIDDSFSRTMNGLSIINLSYNQLKVIPPIPPNVKVLLLANNYITSLNNSQNSSRHLESFISQVGPYSNLEILDLSSNMIAAETSLRVLRDISSLKHLALGGNPLSFMDNYRNIVLSYLNKLAISRHFTLDKKRLSSAEVRYAIEQSKKCKYVPQYSSQQMSGSLHVMTSSQTISSSSSRPSPLSHLTSLTQSFESNSSSLRSSRRKKPKIREISSIDFSESYDENVNPGEDNESIVRVPLGRPNSSLSTTLSSIEKSILGHDGLEETRATIKALRDKYGADHWLLQHPGRSEVSKIIRIPEKPYGSYLEYNPSRSLPSHPERRTGGRRNSCSRCEGLNNNNNESNEKVSSDGISVVASHNNSSADGSDVGSCGDVYSTKFRSKYSSVTDGGNNSSSGVTGDGSQVDTGRPSQRDSIFDMNADYMDEKFPEQSENCEYFRVFLQGQFHNLICYNGFLFEVDPQDSTIYNKWDLNSLVSLEEEKCDAETETVEFRLKFNTMRKQMREKSFIMCAKDFAKFDKLVSPFIERTTMQEFIEALQCTRCHAQFSKAMASKTVKHEKGRAPREILICPDPNCGNEFLVTLDTIPLPNNECLEVDKGSLDQSFPVPIRCSTPCSEKTLPVSVPKDRSPPMIEAIKNFASSLTSRKIAGTDSPILKQNNSLDDRSDCVSDAKTTTSSCDTVLNTRSDSDIEVLSYESSSIEVLNKCGDSESDEIDVPEAEEVPVPEFQAAKNSSKGHMSESTSSGSCAESIVTQYERRLQLQPISQPFSSPITSLSVSTTSSACTSLSSFASNSTLTGSGLNSPHKMASTTIPVRYDYVDFGKIDHRLQLWCELSVFKSVDERLLALVKCLIITESSNVLGLAIFSSLKIYLYKITGMEGDKPQEWLSKMSTYDISKFGRLDVLIGRHGVGFDLSGKYFATILRDAERTSSFLEYFMCEMCGALETPPMVRDLSQTQKALMCPTSPLAYFGIPRFTVCDNEFTYAVSAVVLTQKDIILLSDLSWMAGKASEKVIGKHGKSLATLRQIEFLEGDPTLVRLICDNAKWELLFETEHEKEAFLSVLKTDLQISVPSITVCSPIEP